MTETQTTHPIPPEERKHDYPAHVFPPPHGEYLEYLERASAHLKTLRLIVYAGMTGFLLLAAYGFFLIYQLTVDAQRMVDQAGRMTQQMQAMTLTMSNLYAATTDMRDSMADLRGTMHNMRESMTNMRDDTRMMRVSLGDMDRTMGAVAFNINNMAGTTANMAGTTSLMSHSMRNMDVNSAPLGGFMNSMSSFMPFGFGH
jgi:hypothetical protein